MHKSPVLDNDGNHVWLFGGDDAWKQFEHRGYTVSIEWVFADSGKRIPPVMAIWPSSNILASKDGNKPGTWVISRRDIYRFYADRPGKTDDTGLELPAITGKPSGHCIAEAGQALVVLGKDPNDQQAKRALIDCVMTFGEYLAQIPLAPASRIKERKAPPMWELRAFDKSTGKTIKEGEA